MKLKIDNDGKSVRIELSTDSKKAPLVILLSPSQVEAIIALIRAANSASSMSLELEL
jgi:hypothetical protein